MVLGGPKKGISALQKNRKYPILEAKREDGRFGPTVVLILKDISGGTRRVYTTPLHYASFTDEVINSINEKKILFHVVYRGKFFGRRAFNYSIEL